MAPFILIVHDDFYTLRDRLTAMGFDVIEASSSHHGLALIEEHAKTLGEMPASSGDEKVQRITLVPRQTAEDLNYSGSVAPSHSTPWDDIDELQLVVANFMLWLQTRPALSVSDVARIVGISAGLSSSIQLWIKERLIG